MYDKIDTAFGKESTPELEEKKRILKARAKVLALEPQKETATKGYLEVVEFLLANENYGIESSYIQKVYPLKDFTPLPCTPQFVLGIINVHGHILSVIDFKKLFNLPESGFTGMKRVIILRNEEMEFGILADYILGVRLIPRDEILPSIPTLTGIRAEYVKGVTKDHLIVLAAEKLLSDKRIIVHEDVKI